MKLIKVVTINGRIFRTGEGYGTTVDFIKAWYPVDEKESEGTITDCIEGKPAAFLIFQGNRITTIPFHAVASYTEIDISEGELMK